MPLFIVAVVIAFCIAMLLYLNYTYCRHDWRIMETYHRMDEDGNINSWSTFYECSKCRELKVREQDYDSL